MALEDLVVCSVCRGDLHFSDDQPPSCPKCGRGYMRRNGIYDMTPDPVPSGEVQEKWSLWEQLQDNAAVAYDADPQANLSVGRRHDAKLFADFSELSGLTLDIGCGPQEVPSYGLDFSGRLVGIDPLLGIQPRRFDFVQGIGEYLPFADSTFDRVLFATSLDHMLVPILALQEAKRVTKPNGLVSIWFAPHHHSPDGEGQWRRRGQVALSLLKSRDFQGLARKVAGRVRGMRSAATTDYMSRISVPAGAEDHFHAYNLDQEMVETWTQHVGLQKVRLTNNNDVGCFLLAAPGA